MRDLSDLDRQPNQQGPRGIRAAIPHTADLYAAAEGPPQGSLVMPREHPSLCRIKPETGRKQRSKGYTEMCFDLPASCSAAFDGATGVWTPLGQRLWMTAPEPVFVVVRAMGAKEAGRQQLRGAKHNSQLRGSGGRVGVQRLWKTVTPLMARTTTWIFRSFTTMECRYPVPIRGRGCSLHRRYV